MTRKVMTMPNLLDEAARTSAWRVEVDRGGAGRPLSSKLVEKGSGAALYAVVDAGGRGCGGNSFHASLAWYEPGSRAPARLDEVRRDGAGRGRLASWRSAAGGGDVVRPPARGAADGLDRPRRARLPGQVDREVGAVRRPGRGSYGRSGETPSRRSDIVTPSASAIFATVPMVTFLAPSSMLV